MTRHDLQLAQLAEQHDGIFDKADAHRAGLTDAECTYRVRAGLWVPVFESVYRLPGSVLTPRARLVALSRVLRPDAAVARRSAAFVWDLPGGRNDIVEVVSPHRYRVQRNGVVAHESRNLRDVDRTEVDGIRVTTVPRTIFDLAAVCPAAVVEMAVDRALRHGLTTVAALHDVVTTLGKRGRRGSGALRGIIAARDPRQAPTGSEMETMLRRVLRSHGLPDPVPQFVIRDGDCFVARVDFAYPEQRIAIEYDSVEHHTGTAAHIRDSARRLRIEGLRWHVIVATVQDVRNGGELLVRAIRARSDVEIVRRSA